MPLVKANIRHSVAAYFSNYVTEKKLEDCLNMLSFMDQKELKRRYEFGGAKMPGSVLGYNDGKSSNIAHDIKSPAMNGRVGEHKIEGSSGFKINYAFVTAVHENLHMMSANDQPGETRRGIMVGGNETARAMNEAITEYFTYLSCGGENLYGGLYPGVYSGYQILMQEIPIIEKAVGRDCIMDAYFNNRPEILQQKIDAIIGNGAWEDMCAASYDLMYFNNINGGSSRLIKFLEKLKHTELI